MPRGSAPCRAPGAAAPYRRMAGSRRAEILPSVPKVGARAMAGAGAWREGRDAAGETGPARSGPHRDHIRDGLRYRALVTASDGPRDENPARKDEVGSALAQARQDLHAPPCRPCPPGARAHSPLRIVTPLWRRDVGSGARNRPVTVPEALRDRCRREKGEGRSCRSLNYKVAP